MFFLFFGQGPVSEKEYQSLKVTRETLSSQIDSLVEKLRSTENRWEFLKAVYNPNINIIEVNNKSQGHRYMGKFSIPDMTGKPKRISISIAKADEFTGKDDPRSYKVGEREGSAEAKKTLPITFFMIFSF